jgi:MGT family glycosyltransferase
MAAPEPADILLATVQGGGTIPPQMGLARRLVERGHRVHVLSEPTVEAEARAAGCSFRTWPSAPFTDAVSRDRPMGRDWELHTPGQALRLVRDFGEMIFGAADRFARDVLATLDDLPVRLVLVEAPVFGALAGAERSGVPTVGLMSNTYMRPTRGRPVMGSGWMPGSGALRAVRDRVAPALFEALVDRGLPRLNAVRADLGLDPLPHVFAAFDRCARLLLLTSPTFDPSPSPLPANVRYVGPVLDDPAWAEEVALPDGAAPLVLVAMSSTYQAHQALLQRVVDALTELPVRGLVTLGPGLRPGEVEGAANVAVVPSAAHGPLLRDAAAVVTHAGHGTVLKALAAGVPMVCIPHGRDQGDNTARVLALGAGVRVSRRADAATIGAAVEQVLVEPRFRAGAHRVSAALSAEAHRGPSAVEEIEAVLPSSQPTG